VIVGPLPYLAGLRLTDCVSSYIVKYVTQSKNMGLDFFTNFILSQLFVIGSISFFPEINVDLAIQFLVCL